MILYPYNIILYCFQKGFVSFDNLINAEVATIERTDISLRNNTFQVRVNMPEGANYFIKQPRFLEDKIDEAIFAEYQFYKYINRFDKAIMSQVPTAVHFDFHNRTLIQDFIPHENTVRNWYEDIMNDGKCEDLAGHPQSEFFIKMTKGFANTFRKLRNSKFMKVSYFESKVKKEDFWNIKRRFQPEWLIRDESVIQKYVSSQDVIQRLIGDFISTPPIRHIIKELIKSWEFSHIIHSDIRFENLIMTDKCNRKIFVVDWELVAYGNPLYDAACFIKEIWKKYILQYKEEGVTITKNFTKTFCKLHTKVFLRQYFLNEYSKENAIIIIQMAALQLLFEFQGNKALSIKIEISIDEIISEMLLESHNFLPNNE
jgi:thiamine kinase-like enzyme